MLRLGARGTQSLRICLRLILEPKVSQNRTRHRRGRSPGIERNQVRDTQAVCDFRYLASNATPFFQTVNVIAAIFRATVRRAISGLIPFATRAW